MHPKIVQSIYVDGTNGVVKASGEVDDDVRITVGDQSRGGASESQVHPFNYEFTGLSEGVYTLTVTHYNVSGGDYPSNNLSYLKGTISCMPIGITPE